MPDSWEALARQPSWFTAPRQRPGSSGRGALGEELEQNYPDIELVSAAYQDQDERNVDDIIAAVLSEYPELKAYQAMNEETTEALVSAIEMYGPEDRPLIIAGFDASSAEIEDIEDGKLAGVIAQNPYGMGYAAVVLALREIAGKHAI